MKLSLILPCYNAADSLEQHLPSLTAVLRDRFESFEIIVVDDGSPDGRGIREACEKNGCRLLVHSVNMGKGAAVRTGVLAATGEIILFTDADIPFGYSSIATMYDAMISSHASIGMAARKEGGYHASSSRRRSLGSKVFSWSVRLILWRNLGDTQCGLKAFTRVAAHTIFSRSHLHGFAADVEWLLIAQREKMEVIDVPVELHHQGISTVSLLKHSLPMMIDVWKIRWREMTGGYK